MRVVGVSALSVVVALAACNARRAAPKPQSSAGDVASAGPAASVPKRWTLQLLLEPPPGPGKRVMLLGRFVPADADPDPTTDPFAVDRVGPCAVTRLLRDVERTSDRELEEQYWAQHVTGAFEAWVAHGTGGTLFTAGHREGGGSIDERVLNPGAPFHLDMRRLPGGRTASLDVGVPGMVLHEPAVGRAYPRFPTATRGEPLHVAWDRTGDGLVEVRITHVGMHGLFPRLRCRFPASAGAGVVPGEAITALGRPGRGELRALHYVHRDLAGIDGVDLVLSAPLTPENVDPGEEAREWDNDGPESWWPIVLE